MGLARRLRYVSLRSRCNQRGQTALEYFMMLTLIIIPLALTIHNTLKDSKEDAKDNIAREIVNDAYGDGQQMGVIGRPYP